MMMLYAALIILPIFYFLAAPYLFILVKTVKLIIPKNEICQLFIGQLFSTEKRLITFLTIGLDFSLVITFKLFYEVIYQTHCLTLGEILFSAIVAIASLFATLIPLIYLLFKPAKIFAKYRKAEPKLIKP